MHMDVALAFCLGGVMRNVDSVVVKLCHFLLKIRILINIMLIIPNMG